MAVELKKIPKAKGTAGQGPTLAELGAGKKDAARAQRLAAVGSPSAIFRLARLMPCRR
jgi:hypothetical protein